MKTKLYTLMAAASFFAASCGEKAPDDTKEAATEENKEKFDNDMKADYKFAENAADDGMFEVQVAELAKANAMSQEVKDFAAEMAKDHGMANEELKRLCADKNISIPTALSDDKQDKYGKLAEKKGADFDEAYADMMVKAHKNAVDLFEKEGESGKEPALRDWANEKLPTLRHHLQMAEDLESRTDKEK